MNLTPPFGKEAQLLVQPRDFAREAGVRISELSRRARVSKETISHSIKEGLLPKARKLAKNEAEHEQGHVTRTTSL